MWENPKQADTNWEEDLLKIVKPKTLLLLDRGFYHFAFWSKLISQEIGFITRIKKGASYQVERVLTNTYNPHSADIRSKSFISCENLESQCFLAELMRF